MHCSLHSTYVQTLSWTTEPCATAVEPVMRFETTSGTAGAGSGCSGSVECPRSLTAFKARLNSSSDTSLGKSPVPVATCTSSIKRNQVRNSLRRNVLKPKREKSSGPLVGPNPRDRGRCFPLKLTTANTFCANREFSIWLNPETPSPVEYHRLPAEARFTDRRHKSRSHSALVHSTAVNNHSSFLVLTTKYTERRVGRAPGLQQSWNQTCLY